VTFTLVFAASIKAK